MNKDLTKKVSKSSLTWLNWIIFPKRRNLAQSGHPSTLLKVKKNIPKIFLV
jgi:hypothetical protein